MANQRIKGQEVQVVATLDGVPVNTTSAAKSFNFSFKTEMIQEGYLGETTDRYDTIYKGIAGKVLFHFTDPEIFNLIGAIVDIARRRTPGSKVNIKGTLNFPSGRRARCVIRDAQFGELPIAFGSRADYGTFNLDFGASDAVVMPI